MAKTNIPYVDRVWNPIIGCTPASAGCANCYAAAMHNRIAAVPNQPNYRGKVFGDVRFNPAALKEPAKWRTPQTVLTCSMGDMFHESVPCETIEQIIATMKVNRYHSFLVLTKRANRLSMFRFPDNVMMGVSIENKDNMSRLDALYDVDCSHRWISFEPLIGDVGPINLAGIDWVVVGGENGRNKNIRPCNAQWIEDIYLQCKAMHLPYFFKQYGTRFVIDGVDIRSGAFHRKDMPVVDNPPF